MMNSIRLTAVALFALGIAEAQFDSGQIAGFVRDPSQSVVAGVSVTVTNEGNGEKHHVLSNSTGYYVFPNLFVGLYSIDVEAAGFKKFVQSGIQLSAAAKLSVDIDLTVGSVTDTVEVTATAALVQSETATVGRTVETKQIENLTMNGRNPIYLALLKPGVIGGSIGTFDPDSVSNGGFSINGARGRICGDGGRRGSHADALFRLDARRAGRGHRGGSADPDGQLQRGIRPFFGGPDPVRYQERHDVVSRRPGRELPKLGPRCEFMDAQPRHGPQPFLPAAAIPLQPVRL
jgi:hypothetical protein